MNPIQARMVGLATALVLLAPPAGSSAATDAWERAPVVPQISEAIKKRIRAVVASGKEKGNRAGVFAKVGDSNTDFSPDLYGFACREPEGLSATLRGTVARYNRVRLPNPRALPGCWPWTSFSRRSDAAQAGTFTTWSVTPIDALPVDGLWRKPEDCFTGSTPLDCELDALKPRYAMVMLGTNDIGIDMYSGVPPGRKMGSRLGRVVRALLVRGTVPVLSTVPPIVAGDLTRQASVDRGVARANARIWKLSRITRLPMMNVWRTLTGPCVINKGVDAEGVHLSVYGAGGASVSVMPGPTTFADSVNFTSPALRYGANRRNLIWLKTLARLDKVVG